MDVFSLAAKITLDTDEYENSLGEASTKTHSFGETLKSGLATAAKVGAAGLAAATTAVGALSKAALDSYGDYEQLTGGVETLFGAGGKSLEEYAASVGKSVNEVERHYIGLQHAQNAVFENAANAYKTAGLSANEYMETVTSFSAALIQSLGGDTDAAAVMADLAITDMADNANKMGSDIASIQAAYQGFSKQNYTMLDNLKLGYGGTATEMARLINDSGVLGDKMIDLNDTQKIGAQLAEVGYAQMVEAIHVVQTEMGITGTTAKEAKTTIQGSVSSMKSAWKNLVTGLGNENANLDDLLNEFVESVGTVGENVIPRVEQILTGIGGAIQTMAPIIGEQLPPLIQSVLPSLLSAGGSLVAGIANGLLAAIPGLLDTGLPMVTTLIEGIAAALPNIATYAIVIITTLADGITEQLPVLIPVAIAAILQLADTLTDPDNLSDLFDSAIDLIMALADGLIDSIPALLEKAPVIVQNLVTAIVENAPKLLSAGLELVLKIGKGILDNLGEIGGTALSIVQSIINGIADIWWKIVDIGKNIIEGVWEGISGAADWLKEKIADLFGRGIVKAVQDSLDMHSPSRVFAKIGKNMALGVGVGWDDAFPKIQGDILSGFDISPDIKYSVGLDAKFDKVSAKKQNDIFKDLMTNMSGVGLESELMRYSQIAPSRNAKMGRLETENVDFASSAVGRSSAAIANTISSGSADGGAISLTINLLTGDGDKFATWLLPDLIRAADAAGTPIASGQYA